MNAQERYKELVDDVLAQNPDVQASKMMGMPCVKRGGKMVAGFSRGDEAMTFKLTDPAEHAEALALEGAHLFDPGGNNRPFKQWVVVPSAHADEWERLLQRALAP